MSKLINILLVLIIVIGLYSCSSTVRFASSYSYRTNNNNLGSNNPISSKSLNYENLSTNELRMKIIEEAKNWIGTPYRYGGESKNGVDCSGFVMSVYHNAGIEIPRTSQQQFNYVELVNKNQCEAGDLVFFEKNHQIFHVGIYLGANSIIHASTSKGVIIQSLDDAFLSNNYSSVGKIIK